MRYKNICLVIVFIVSVASSVYLLSSDLPGWGWMMLVSVLTALVLFDD